MARSRSPRGRVPELTLYAEEGASEPITLAQLAAKHGGAPVAPFVAPGSQGDISNGALCDWRLSDADIRDDALFRLGDKSAATDVLYGLNRTDRCARCIFKEDTHEYFIDGTRAPWSGTAFSHYCERHFDARAVSERVARIPGWAAKRGMVHADGRPFDALEIARAWSDNGNSQSRRGTLMHWQVECHLNGYRIGEPRSPEFELFLFFERAFLQPLGLVPWRTEMNLFHCGLRLAGQADLVCKDTSGDLVILDWKRTREIKTRSPDGNMRAPLEHLPSCNLYTYYLQLNTYRHMLESEYRLRVSGMYIVVLHPEQKPLGPHVYVVPRMEREIEALAEHVGAAKGFCPAALPGAAAPFDVGELKF